MKKSYHTIGKQGKVNQQELAGYLARSGQILLPMVDLIEQCRLACDELIDVTGRAAIEAVLQLSANHAAGGPAQQGIFGDYTMIGAVGVDVEGNKHVLGIREGATENSTVITALLEDIVARGVDPKRKMLFVIDGSKALRAAINAVFGAHQPVQRCRAHKLRNVLDYLSKEDRPQVKSVLRAAWKLPPKEGMARIKKLAAWLDQKYPSAASSLIEGLEECFTINRLDVPPSLYRCLATTNIIESPHAGVRIQTRRVTHWQNGNMVMRWMASAFLRTEKRFNKIMGYRDLWALEAILNPAQHASAEVAA